MDNPQFMKVLAENLNMTMSGDPSAIKHAEKNLDGMKAQPGFALALMKLMSSNAIESNIRLAASIYFKNFIMMNWEPEDGKDIVSPNDRTIIKQNILHLMLASPKLIQAQCTHALGIISITDFHEGWPSLLPSLIKELGTDQTTRLRGVLETAHSLFHRYRFEERSDTLWLQIAYVLKLFAKPFLELLKATCTRIQQFSKLDDLPKLKQQFEILNLLTEIFISLSSQDIPEFFQENLKDFMGIFLHFIKYRNPKLDPEDDEKPGLLDKNQELVCELANLYTAQYEEFFADYVSGFVGEIFTLLTALTEAERFDQLVSKAIVFLTTVVSKKWHMNLFEKEGILELICKKVIIPQIKLRAGDIELFKQNGLEYLRRDIEGSDQDTRRRTSVDFVRGLCVNFEEKITAILKNDISTLMGEYSKAPATNWIHKDAAMFLVLALTVKGSVQSKGATQLNPYINIMDFFKSQVLPELKQAVSNLPILKADCLKFVAAFRAQVPREMLAQLLPLLYRHLESADYVVHTYAAYAVEKILSVKDDKGTLITKETLKPHVRPILTLLFKAMKHPDSGENAYLMKCVLRVCATSEEMIAEFVKVLMDSLTNILKQVAKNPRTPTFNHFVFETQACIIKYMCKANPASVANFEREIFPPFQIMLGMETCQEFGPYVFQILAQMLEIRKEMAKPYEMIFGPILSPTLWNNKGNIPPMVRLLSSYIKKGPSFVVPKLTGVLGVFQKLNASSKQDVYGFELLKAVVEYVPRQHLEPQLPEILKLILLRVKAKSTTKFLAMFITWMCHVIVKYDSQVLMTCFDKVQPGLFSNVTEKLWAPNIKCIYNSLDRKIVYCGMAKFLFGTPALTQGQGTKLWCLLVQGLMISLKTKGKVEANVADAEDYDVDSKAFSAAYVQLKYAAVPPTDVLPQCKSARAFLANSFKKGLSSDPKIKPIIQELPVSLQKALQLFLQNPNAVEAEPLQSAAPRLNRQKSGAGPTGSPPPEGSTGLDRQASFGQQPQLSRQGSSHNAAFGQQPNLTRQGSSQNAAF
eukprot:gb/GEZN01000952.1/.p1 GENE.gb/GEZN01000952.1/~~gb/GEZN01000952.1/.p1  ORF type:complete len:1035 (+),score=156.51 gb/GEZN01000952.1/:38-3142(+)